MRRAHKLPVCLVLFLSQAVKEADKYYEELRARGVSLVPLVVDADVDPQDKLKKLKRELNRRDT
eukprot:365851-Chlamydomonas_euryale.AAC.3